MAEMTNIEIKDFTTVLGLEDSDYVVISLSGGSSAKVAVQLLRSVIAGHITPSIREGVWWIGETNQEVDALGKTPEFRKSELGIEYKYTVDSDSEWQLLVPFSDIRFTFDELTDEQRDMITLHFSDLTEEEVAELQQPAADMIAQLEATDEAVKAAEAFRVEAEEARVEAEEVREQEYAALKGGMQAATDSANDTADHPTYIGEDNYVYQWDKTTKAYNKTEIYVRGEGFHISKVYASIEEMHADTEHGLKEGDFVLVNTDDVENPDNAQLFVLNEEGVFTFLVDMSGAIGFTGKTPQLSIGSVSAGTDSSDASASLSDNGTDEDGNPKYKLNLTLPTLTYDDLTAEDIAELQAPANEMIAQLEATDTSVKEAEALRVSAEASRVEAESSRVEAESARVEAENGRADNETLRQTAESTRDAAENERKNAEASRVDEEANRVSAETARATEFAALREDMTEATENANNAAAEVRNVPKIQDGTWWVYDATVGDYVDSGANATGKAPQIINGTWWTWNEETGELVDTGQSVSSDYVLTKEKVENVLTGKIYTHYHPMMMTWVENWNHLNTPYKEGSAIKFNQGLYVALTETELPPVPLTFIEDGVVAMLDAETYAVEGSYEAVGNKDDWRKIPLEELHLRSREGTLNGAAANLENLSGDDAYKFEPNLDIDLVHGTIKGKKTDFTLKRNNVVDAIGYEPAYLTTQNELSEDMAYVLSTIESNFEGLYYGVEWDTTVSSPSLTRIGDMNMHRTLPIHNKMRGCLLDDNGNVTKYLNASSWTSEKRDGSQGQVMVEIPAHYRKFETEGTKRRVKLSLVALAGYHKVPKMYVSAYEASLQRSTLKLASVVNTSTDYRGGNNTADWDGTYRSLLGRPATLISRTDFRTYARNRKEGRTEWNLYTYDAQANIYWLFCVEYATFNSQASYNASLTSNGFKQGGLGAGVTGWSSSAWSSFNGYYPFVPCGHTDSLGNGTGTVSYSVVDSSDATLITFAVPRYRGIENPFGHIWQWTDGANIRISPTEANDGDNLSKVFICHNPEDFNDENYEGYEYVGDEARAEGYAKTHIFGEQGVIVPDVVGGGSTTYMCDYHYTNIPSAETLRGLLFGGDAYSGALAGLGYANSHSVPSYSDARIGSRLCFQPKNN